MPLWPRDGITAGTSRKSLGPCLPGGLSSIAGDDDLARTWPEKPTTWCAPGIQIRFSTLSPLDHSSVAFAAAARTKRVRTGGFWKESITHKVAAIASRCLELGAESI